MSDDGKYKELECEQCGTKYNKRIYYLKNNKHNFCCKKCKNEWQKGKCPLSEEQKKDLSIRFRGENNPNYCNKWSDEQKKRGGQLTSLRMTDEMKAHLSAKLTGRKISEESMKNYAEGGKKRRGRPQYIATEETKNKIGIKSLEKFTSEFKIKFRKTNEDRGYWIPLDEKEDYIFYRDLSNWKGNLIKFLPQSIIDSFNKIGMFNCINNTDGYVRDHNYSRRSGFENSVFPEILRHPVNMQLILNSQNTAKKTSRYRDRDDQTLEELFYKIINFNQVWEDQELCIELITKYKNGERYLKEDYIRKIYQ